MLKINMLNVNQFKADMFAALFQVFFSDYK